MQVEVDSREMWKVRVKVEVRDRWKWGRRGRYLAGEVRIEYQWKFKEDIPVYSKN